MENNEIFVSIAGCQYYYGTDPLKIGTKLQVMKDPDNKHDPDAIALYAPIFDKIGYVANSTHTTYKGTVSASKLHSLIPDECAAVVYFVIGNGAIAKVFPDKCLSINLDISFVDVVSDSNS